MAALLAVLGVVATFVAGAISPVVRAADVATSFPVHAEFRPNDPYYIDQWGMQKIGAPNAWDVTLGSPSVVVAVVDTGVWWTHQDIQANMWVNPPTARATDTTSSTATRTRWTTIRPACTMGPVSRA